MYADFNSLCLIWNLQYKIIMYNVILSVSMDKQETNMHGNQNTFTHAQTCRRISYMHLINKL